MISRNTQSTVTLCVRSVFHRHHQMMMMMMKREVWGKRPVHFQINTDDQKKMIWNIWFQEDFGVEVIKLESKIYILLHWQVMMKI